MSETRLMVTWRQRGASLLDDCSAEPVEDPSFAALKQAVTGPVWITGGEPTLRKDFPALLRELPVAGIITDGAVFAHPKAIQALGDRLPCVRVRLHSARADAHDFLVGTPGAWKRTVRGIQALVQGRIPAQVEVGLTRPTMDHLEETVRLVHKLGVRHIVFRRITALGEGARHDVMLVARWGLLIDPLDAAVARARRSGMTVRVEGVPGCIAPEGVLLEPVFLRAAEGPWPFLEIAPPHAPGCAECSCVGPGQDYIDRFGRGEIESTTNERARAIDRPERKLADGTVWPPSRGGRAPYTRVRDVVVASKRPTLGDDPLIGIRATPEQTGLRMAFRKNETTRSARIRLVKLAQHRPETLRIVQDRLDHPQIAELVREVTRLQFDRVELAGELGGLALWSDAQLRRVRKLTRVDATLFSPDPAEHDALTYEGAYDDALEGMDRLSMSAPRMEIGVTAVVRSALDLDEWLELWASGELPGEPSFRLSEDGGELAPLLAKLPELGDAASALAAVLPKCQHGMDVPAAPSAQPAWGLQGAEARPSRADRYGQYSKCPNCDDQGCVGHALGWR